jgi:hypothetical protein
MSRLPRREIFFQQPAPSVLGKSQWRNAGHRHVRSALNIRPLPQNFEGPFRADIVEKVENRMAPKISRMSNVGDLSRCKALQNRCERRWSLLR